jgi:hypothetical protein
MRCLALTALFVLGCLAMGAPIPKSLKIKKKNFDYDGYWELTGQNMNGKVSPLTLGKYWKIDKDKFYYSIKDMESIPSGNAGKITTPDESQPTLKMYNDNTRCLLDIDDDQLTWIFANDKADPLDNCDPAPQRVIYYFKRAK